MGLSTDVKDEELVDSVEKLEVLEVVDNESKISDSEKVIKEQTQKECNNVSNSNPIPIGCAENVKEVVEKKRQTKKIVLSIENNLSWWNDDAMKNLRSCLEHQQRMIVDAVPNEGGVIPFVAEAPQSDGIVGGEICFPMSPCDDNSASWLERTEM